MSAERLGLRAHGARILLACLVAALGYVAFPAIPEHGGVAFPGLGTLGLNVLMMLLFWMMLAYFRPGIWQSLRAVTFFALGFIVVLVVAGLFSRQHEPRVELIPVPLPVFLFAVLFDGRIAAVAAMAMAALIASQPALRGTDALAFAFIGGVAAALALRRIRSRGQAWRFVLTVGAIYAAAAAVSGIAQQDPLKDIGLSAALGGMNALGSAALAMMLLPLAESFTRSITDLKLLELSDPAHPLLRRLALEAPGTYAHSVAMANLCEAACDAIGADGLLARVGCYYHDVGKLRNPQYFAENQGRGRSPHEQLPPERSADIIRRHVEDGIALAKAHKLPESVWRFIPEHHGTQELAFFGAAQYPGPLPQTPETAVALLADAVEAALRVLDDPTPETIADAIDHLVGSRIEAGQLREAPLTLRQIDIVRRTFVRTLTAMHHNRIEYPEEHGGITADWEAAG